MDTMAKAGELDWSELKKSDEEYNHTPTALWAADKHGGGKEGVDPLNKAKPRIAEGEVPVMPSDDEIAATILHNAPSQPTDEQMFGHLVVTEEQVQKAEKEWANSMNKAFDDMKAPITPTEEQEHEWADGKSFNESLSREELEARNMYTD
jgi:hypothetical protein